jgi:hypothetical protein
MLQSRVLLEFEFEGQKLPKKKAGGFIRPRPVFIIKYQSTGKVIISS